MHNWNLLHPVLGFNPVEDGRKKNYQNCTVTFYSCMCIYKARKSFLKILISISKIHVEKLKSTLQGETARLPNTEIKHIFPVLFYESSLLIRDVERIFEVNFYFQTMITNMKVAVLCIHLRNWCFNSVGLLFEFDALSKRH